MNKFAKFALTAWAGSAALMNAGAQSNTPPVLREITNQFVVEFSVLTVTNTATGTTNHLNYALLGAPPGALIDTNGVITWRPAEIQGPSTNTITTIVADDSVPPLTALNSFTVFVAETNSPPQLRQQNDQTITSLATLSVTNVVFDADLPTNTISYALVDPVAGAAIDPVSGVITWSPGQGFIGTTNTFTTVATDNGLPPLSGTNSFHVVVISPDAIYLHTNAILAVNFNLTVYAQTRVPTPSTNLVDEIQTIRISTAELVATIGRNRGLGTNVFPKNAKLFLKLPDMNAQGATFVVRAGNLETNIGNNLQLSAPSAANQNGAVTGIRHRSSNGTTNQADYVVLEFDLFGSRASFSVQGLALLLSSSVISHGDLISSEPVISGFTANVSGSGRVFLGSEFTGNTAAYFRGTVTAGGRKIEIVHTNEP